MELLFTPDTVVAAAGGQVSANMGGEEVILDLSAGIYYGLDAVGASVWALLEKPCTVASLQEAILAEYDVDPAQCLHDLQALLGELHRLNLVAVEGLQEPRVASALTQCLAGSALQE